VYKSRPESPGEDKVESVQEEGEDEDGPKEGWVPMLWKWFKGLFPGLMRGLVDFSKEVYRPIKAEAKETGGGWRLIFGFPFLPLLPILIGTRLPAVGSNNRRVGTFSPLPPGRLERSRVLKIAYSSDLGYPHIMMVVVGIAFGGIHCIAWAFQFPSHTEQLLWRISAISVTGVPILVTCTAKFALDYADSDSDTTLLKNLALLLGFLILIPSVALYLLARFTLLVLPFLSLRSLPPGAYRTADWTRFIPHIY